MQEIVKSFKVFRYTCANTGFKQQIEKYILTLKSTTLLPMKTRNYFLWYKVIQIYIDFYNNSEFS